VQVAIRGIGRPGFGIGARGSSASMSFPTARMAPWRAVRRWEVPRWPRHMKVAGALPLHPAQVSVTYPGYPRQDPGESDAAHRFRRDRDAAHLDGLLPVGPEKRRFLRETHAFILGIAVTEASEGAAPLVVWEGSHRMIRDVFAQAFDGVPARRSGQGST
jgi:hypothetical protein